MPTLVIIFVAIDSVILYSFHSNVLWLLIRKSISNECALESVHNRMSTLVIILVAVGAAILLICVIILSYFAWYCYKKKRRAVAVPKIYYDPKGFSSNDLCLLNRKSVSSGCTLESVRVEAKGSIVLNPNPWTVNPAETVTLAAVPETQPTATQLNCTEIQEFLDLSNMDRSSFANK
ncbi:hypothetical protein Ddc_09416 [Ditylenchus destructor]|nr:hypothetical protein Ddc_09416 [Ditylenchus destructor]